MNIVGPDELVFGVEDLDVCARYLRDYGLAPAEDPSGATRLEALDGTAVVLRAASDRSLPPPTSATCLLRETIYGVADDASLDAIAAELSKDREVSRARDGSIACFDDMGFALRFRRTRRRAYTAPPDLTNAPGHPPQRPPNQIGAQQDMIVAPRTLSHLVLFVPDAAKAEKFYARLGFRTTDRFTGVGPFMRPAGTLEHHTLFMIQTPAFLKGLEHFTFHVGSVTELMLAGARFEAKGYETFWGPGRHVFGSNWFWYFNSPLGCHVEYDADMDLHDDSWVPREAPATADSSQLFLLSNRKKWFPSGAPPK
ncbi:MAG TPA: VOC family protein [Steroidobacteraceae bacterium]|jgi:catechol 2,3-dioxygenase-like lactoylglutathione lyase family enzyme|nr:VOC family protein [Steroidobacteraceae bacterium]